MVTVLDGGLATTLQCAGHSVDGDPLWSARQLRARPAAVVDAHAQFIAAGADVVITASYQACVENLHQHLGLSADDARALMGSSVTLAREAISRSGRPDVLVAGSVGPYGACQADGSEYTGQYLQHMNRETLREWHRPRVAALVGAGADLLAVETIPGPAEALAVLDLLREHPGQRAWISFSCQDGGRTCDGTPIGAAVSAICADRCAALVAVGVNCCSPEHARHLVPAARAAAGPLPVVVYPNSGETWTGDGWSGAAAGRRLASYAAEFRDGGAAYIGGCCRVGPDQIAELRQLVDAW